MTIATAETCLACGWHLGPPIRRTWIGPPATGGQILECVRCGSGTVVPQPTPKQLEELYGEAYYKQFISGQGVAGGVTDASDALKRRLRMLEDLTPRGTLLDLGCAIGTFVAHARSMGWDAIGVEPSPWAAEQARQHYGLEIHCGTLESAPIRPGSVDVVHANHVIEHLADPFATLAAAMRILRPDGLIVIEVPQELRRPLVDWVSSGFQRRFSNTPNPNPTYHVTFFTVQGLTSLARRAGFLIEKLRSVRHDRSGESRFPLGVTAKRVLYALEERFESAPAIELVGRRPRG